MEEIKNLKTFRDLVPGDNVWVVDFQKELKIPENEGDFPNILSVHRVAEISLGENDSVVIALEGHKDRPSFLAVDLDTSVQFVSIANTFKYPPYKGLNHYVYFTDEKRVSDVCENSALRLLREQDTEKDEYMKRYAQRTAKIRNVFHEYLRNEKH